MVKNKYLGIAWLVVSFALVGTGGFFFWHSQHHTTSKNSELSSDDSGDSTATINGSTISLNQGATNISDSNGLKATGSSSSSDLGQLGGNSKQAAGGNQLLPSSGSSSGGSSSSNSGLPDPSTFSQYEKYKSGTSALFGDIVKGTGAELGANQKAAVYYRGFLTNGQVFDESRAGSDGKLQPFTFTEGGHQVISGWEQGLYGMKEGGVRLLIVPPSVGYGDQAQGSIPAGSVLVFEVQLVQVQ